MSSTPPPIAAGFSVASGHVIVSADRLFGVWAWNTTSSVDVGDSHTDDEASGTVVNLLWSDAGVTPYAMPRLGVDALIGPGFTLGGSIGYLASSGSGKATSTASNPATTSTALVTTRELPNYSAFVFTPRLGGVVTLGEHAALWLRGGITYFHSTDVLTIEDTSTMPATTFTRTITTNATALTVDPEIVIFPAAHFGLTLGVVADIGLGGSIEVEESAAPTGTPPILSWDSKVSSYGVTAGVLGIF